MAKYKIQIKRSAVKEIEELPPKDLKKVLAKIEALSADLRSSGVKKLSIQEKYRVRCGHYRILQVIEDLIVTVYVVKAGHRKEVYGRTEK